MAHLNTLLGGIVWIGPAIARLSGQGALSTLTLILLPAVLVVAPLGLMIVFTMIFAGAYAFGRLTVRLPILETITAWAANRDEAKRYFGHPAPTRTTVAAQHEMWLFAKAFLTVHYSIFPER